MLLRTRLSRCSAGIACTYTRGGNKVTRLPNGLRIMSWDCPTGLANVGVFMLMGSRVEDEHTNGCSAIYDRYLYHSNKKLTASSLYKDFAYMGNSVAVNNHRECATYLVQCPNYYVPQAVDLLSGALLAPDFDDAATFRNVIAGTVDTIAKRSRDPTRCCFELLHQAAYGGLALGRSAFFTESDIRQVTPETMKRFVANHVRPSSTVVAACGVSNHEEFVEQVRNCFQFPADSEPCVPLATSYVGGIKMQHNTHAPESVEKFTEKNDTHISLFFPIAKSGLGVEYITMSIIQCMMGGGQSFSSGGPGKGMLTKLYREVIHREAWIHSIECVTASYTDSAILGLYGSAPHDFNRHLLDILVNQIATIPNRIDDYHVEMAKHHLLSQLYLVNDISNAQTEDAGRCLLLFDSVLSYDETKELVSKVTLNDIRTMCMEMLQHPGTLAVYGNTSGIYGAEQLAANISAAQSRRR